MTTKQIIQDMEKEFNEKFKSREGEETAYAQGWILLPDDIKSFISSYTRTLLESFGEEVIGEDETEVNQIARDEKLGVQTYYVITANMKRRNQLRAEQRLKMKEIISSIGK